MESLLASTHSEKLDDTQIQSIDKMTEGSVPEIIDCLANSNGGTDDIINKMRTEVENMSKEINSAIKVSNATTEIEF